MIIDKAIEILDTHQCDMPRNEVPDLIAAIKLGIEALKEVKWLRDCQAWNAHEILPGETKE